MQAGDAPAAGDAPTAAAAAPAGAGMAGGGAPAASDAPAAAGYVYIKRAGDAPADYEVYAALPILPGDTVALLAERACAKFARWGAADAGQVRLYLVPHEGVRKPLAEAEARATLLDEPALSLADAGIVSGSWLLARVPRPPAAAGASCGAIYLQLATLLAPPLHPPTLLFPTRSTPSQMHPRACRGEPPPMRARCPRRRPSARLLSTRRARRWAPSSARFVLGRRMCRACSRAR